MDIFILLSIPTLLILRVLSYHFLETPKYRIEKEGDIYTPLKKGYFFWNTFKDDFIIGTGIPSFNTFEGAQNYINEEHQKWKDLKTRETIEVKPETYEDEY